MTNDYDRIKTPRDLKANTKTYRVDKNKGSGYKNRDLFLAGTSKTRRKKKKNKITEEHPLAKAFTGEFDSFSLTRELKLPIRHTPLVLLFLLLRLES